MANKLRHIAISVRDPEKAAKFFEDAFGMTRAGNAQRGVYMTDGIFNVALLNFGDEQIDGFEDRPQRAGPDPFRHVGRQRRRDRQEDPRRRRQHVTGRKETDPNVYYEVKYADARKASSSTSPRAAGRAR